MTKVQALEEEIEKLSSAELVELREWIIEREAEVWDREIERDAASGKLDKLFEKSVADHHAGKSRFAGNKSHDWDTRVLGWIVPRVWSCRRCSSRILSGFT